MKVFVVVLVVLIGLCPNAEAIADDVLTKKSVKVTFKVTGDQQVATERTVTGRVWIEAQDGGVLLEERDGTLHAIKGPDVVDSVETDQEFEPLTAEELSKQLLEELGEGFEAHQTEHYLIISNTGELYSEWVGGLFERLHEGFLTYWKRAGLEVAAPSSPLIAIVFRDREQFQKYAILDAGTAVANVSGYYSVRSNRIILADLTADAGGATATTRQELQKRIDASDFNVATVVHEATHQLAFNCGVHTRYADNPMWVAEGLAMFCETPDTRSKSGWKTLGVLHKPRLGRFREYAESRRNDDSLLTLIQNEDRFRDVETITDAYAESWALTYFLIRRHRDEYVKYLHHLAAKPRLQWETPETRVREFKQYFGDDLGKLEREFAGYLRRLK